MIEQGLYAGRLVHQRETPSHRFRRDLLMAYCDIDVIDEAPAGCLRIAPGLPVFVRREDHLTVRGADSLRPTLRGRVEALTRSSLGREARGPMALLTQPRAFGLTFDPASFVYCFDRATSRLETVVVEVTNTPWGERHAYVLDVRGQSGDAFEYEAPKSLHVSPFFGMDHRYHFRFTAPGPTAHLSIENHRDGQPVFYASLELKRASGLAKEALGPLLRHPAMPVETLIGIYAQALRLAWKRTPFHPHPRKHGTRPSPHGLDHAHSDEKP